jgi:hypothetical protein
LGSCPKNPKQYKENFMKTYITEQVIDGEKYEGEKIKARSWDEASLIAQERGIVVIGELA